MPNLIVIYLLSHVLFSVPTNGVGETPHAATNTPPATATSFDAFRIISDRNIFNQNRSPRTARRESQEKSRPAPVVQSISLVGIMSYEKGTFAFFDGSSPEFRKPKKVGEKIAEYEIKEVQPSSVKIGNDKQEFEIRIGQQLRREDAGDWHIAAAGSRTSQSGNGADRPAEAATSSSGDASEDEAVRRLMEKRAKEMNQ